MARRRLDAELVRRGLARSREVARELVEAGSVEVRGMVVTKPDRQVSADEPVTVKKEPSSTWVSRGSGKLIGALDHFTEISVAGRVCLDAGASTGGFTDVLLKRGAQRVYAVDVGYGQLAWSLQTDDRVTLMDRTNVRNVTATQFDGPVSLVVADLSFISLRTVLPALALVADVAADYVLMVKPQFEVGKSKIGKKGVVRDPQLRAEAVTAVLTAAAELGLGCHGVVASPLPGPNGNVEYFVWLRRGSANVGEDDVVRAIAEGPA
ncbi:MAG: TlyA family RNA methyltransferase [Candidatus Nanopelagicales bacterium]|nr:TlyA family RNA methyltransferase [Candidatus Nanopelagicales bacterium]